MRRIVPPALAVVTGLMLFGTGASATERGLSPAEIGALAGSAEYTAYRGYGRRVRRGRRGNAAAAAAAVGVAGALIGGAIAAQQSRRYYDGYGYGYAPPGYGYYGPGPGYYGY